MSDPIEIPYSQAHHENITDHTGGKNTVEVPVQISNERINKSNRSILREPFKVLPKRCNHELLRDIKIGDCISSFEGVKGVVEHIQVRESKIETCYYFRLRKSGTLLYIV